MSFSRLWPVAAALVLTAAVGCTPNDLDVDITYGDESPAVVNGKEADLKNWLPVVEVTTGFGSCTGSIVGPRTVITAAHCLSIDLSKAGPPYALKSGIKV